MSAPESTSSASELPDPAAAPVRDEVPADSRLAVRSGTSADRVAIHYTPLPDVAGPTLLPAAVHAMLRAAGYGDWWRNDQAVAQLLQQLPVAREAFSIEVAEQRNGRALVQVSSDRMTATLTLYPPQGGQPATLDDVRAALAEKKVVKGVMEEALDAALRQGEVNQLIVAHGKPMVNGEHTRFEKLVPDMADRHPHIDEDGLTDYRNLGDLVLVKAGTPLLRRIPPTAGEEGHDVLGNVLRPKPGTSWPFAPGLKGVEADSHDPDVLVASVAGQPIMVTRGVKVDPNIVVQQVDLSTGNIRFDGAVQIKGDVTDGMKVISTGDVLVGGAVLAGEIQAGGNVIVKGGVIGHSEYNGRDSGRNSWFSAKVEAVGTIHARYAENAFLQSEADVLLDDYAMHSEVIALNHVIVGKQGARKGKVIGGHTRASISIRVAEAGSEAGGHTEIQAGHNPLLEDELASIRQRMAKHEAEMVNLQKIIDFVHAHPERDKDGLLGRASLTQELHEGELLELQTQEHDVQEAMGMSADAHIAVEYRIHSGVRVQLGGKVWETADDVGGGVFRLDDDGNLVLGR